jgi:hypothetical protein
VSDLFGYDDDDGRSPAPGSRGPAADRADGLPSVRAGAGRPSLPPPPLIRAYAADRELAQKCAKTMLESARRHGYEDRFGDPSSRSHYVGALGEILFARFLVAAWECHPRDIGGRPDVAGYEVRAISPETRYFAVKSKPNDRPETRIASVAIVAGRDGDGMICKEAGGLILGWISAAQLREIGKRGDPGNRGAPGWFLEDFRKLSRDWRK